MTIEHERVRELEVVTEEERSKFWSALEEELAKHPHLHNLSVDIGFLDGMAANKYKHFILPARELLQFLHQRLRNDTLEAMNQSLRRDLERAEEIANAREPFQRATQATVEKAQKLNAVKLQLTQAQERERELQRDLDRALAKSEAFLLAIYAMQKAREE